MTSPARHPQIRVGIIGVGNWARHGHLRVLDLLPGYETTAVYSQDAERAAATATRYGIGYVARSVEELVSRADIDLVAVLTTAPQHAAQARTAIASGKDIYCEWPLTTSTDISEALLRQAETAGVRHLTGLQRRHAPHNRYLKDLLAQGYVGKLRSVRMHVSMSYFQQRLPNALRWTIPPENFSSMVAIYGGHFLDMLFTATGWPTAISALAVNQFPTITIAETGETFPATNADEFVLTGRLENGAVVIAHFEGGKRNGSGVQIDITGDEGDLRITNSSAFGDVGDDYQIIGARGDRLPLEPLPIPPSYLRLPESGLPSAVLELAELYWAHAEDVAIGSTAAATFGDAVRMHRLIDAAMASSRTGQRINLD